MSTEDDPYRGQTFTDEESLRTAVHDRCLHLFAGFAGRSWDDALERQACPPSAVLALENEARGALRAVRRSLAAVYELGERLAKGEQGQNEAEFVRWWGPTVAGPLLGHDEPSARPGPETTSSDDDADETYEPPPVQELGIERFRLPMDLERIEPLNERSWLVQHWDLAGPLHGQVMTRVVQSWRDARPLVESVVHRPRLLTAGELAVVSLLAGNWPTNLAIRHGVRVAEVLERETKAVRLAIDRHGAWTTDAAGQSGPVDRGPTSSTQTAVRLFVPMTRP